MSEPDRPDAACACRSCTELSARWRQRHAEHLAPGATFETAPFNHPSGLWRWLVCPCGAKHLTGGGG